MSSKRTALTLAPFAIAALTAAMIAPAQAQDTVGACLITKTDTNPFFVKMKEGATAKAEELGIELSTFAGKVDGDHESQVAGDRRPASPPAPRASSSPPPTPRPSSIRSGRRATRAARHRPRHAARADRRGRRDLRHRQLPRRRADRAVGGGQDGRRRGRCEDRDARSRRQPAVGRRAPRPGFPDRLRHRRQGRLEVGRRGRRADHRQRGHRRQLRRRPDRDGVADDQGSGHQPRLHDQRAGGGRRVRGAEGLRVARTRSRSSRSTAAAPASRTSPTASSARPASSTRC